MFVTEKAKVELADLSRMASESVKVVVRCRPLNNREKALNCKMVVSVDCSHSQCFIEKPGAAGEPPKQFTFDGTYFINQTTEQMYNEIAYPLVEVNYFPLCSFTEKGIKLVIIFVTVCLFFILIDLT